ncbi:STAS domain-containing protein [Chroococcidiopsis sp. TS-821]|uniref:STAS domain-containing protein n=1 Tax=Chroococcidiopsis sp. TS-821 TaxID=1378066 RepID=UPI000CEE42B2|nr:STAS domain-containing protein [Chroococcidiopsis sp. TS-821]PPS44761.1 anti-anti-sigma factor [Chroococcidiopsis sp. TS-821]
MSITHKNGRVIVLHPQGRLDCDGSKQLEAQFTRLMGQRNLLWVINLSQVDFMDSAGLVALITGLKAARESSCRLILCHLPEPVKLILELTQLDSVFEICEDYNAVLNLTKTPALAA